MGVCLQNERRTPHCWWQRLTRTSSGGFVALLMKYPYDDTDENKNPELCVAKSFSLRRKLIAAIRGRAAHLGVSMSAYVATLVKNDLVRGIDAPLSLEPGKVPTSAVGQSGRGVVVEFDLEDD